MSNPFKAIGKVFKGIVNVVKKIALPVLAIGAVILTGGAALGVLPALGGTGGLLASVGIKGALASILTTAASAATFGAVGAAITGGNIIKGATSGFMAGALMGGVGAAMGGLGGTAQTAAQGAQQVSATGAMTPAQAQAAMTSSGTLEAGTAIGKMPSLVDTSIGLGGTGASSGLAAASGAGSGVLAPVASSAGSLISSAPAVSSGGGLGGAFGRVLGGVGTFAEKNPILFGNLVSGVGQGIMANEAAKERRREQERIAASYDGIGSVLPTYDGSGGLGMPQASTVFNSSIYQGQKVSVDPRTGQLVVGG